MTARSKALRAALAAALAAALVLPGAAVLGQGTTISFLTPPWGAPPDQALLDAFQAESGITVDIQSVQMTDLFSRVQVAAGSGTPAADVIFLTEEAPSNIVATGNMMPLNDLMADVDFSDFTKTDFWTMDGQLYGVPVSNFLAMMDFNEKRVAEAGFTSRPTTWQELKDQALAIKAQGIDEYPIAMGAIDWSWYLIALSMGDPMFDADLNPVFANEGSKAREAMAMLLSFFEEGLITPDILSGDPTTQHTSFWSGSGTFHQGWQGSVAVGNGADSAQAPDVRYLVLPEEGKTWSFPAAIGIAAGSPNAEAAKTFIEWYTSPEHQHAIHNAFGHIPARTSVAEQLAAEDKIAGHTEIVEQAGKVNELPRFALWWGPFTTAVSTAILEAVQAGIPADEVIDGLAQEWNDLRAEYE
ncbi:MAG: ABC transporter substrate-binding protein [Chloroflexota bacterium]